MIKFIEIDEYYKDRNKFYRNLNRRYGKGNWFWVFHCGKFLYSLQWGLQLYEDAYWAYFRSNLEDLKSLVEGYSNVFVLNNKDLESDLNFNKQTQEKDHFADIAIRRCLVRLGLKFKGKELLSILDSKLDDRTVRFHLPHLLTKYDEHQSARSWIVYNRKMIVATEVEDQCKLAHLLVT